MQKIVPNLWFDTQAEEAANFYVSLFPESKIINITRFNKTGAEISGKAEGAVMTMEFELNGQHFTAINGGPMFKFTEAISFLINCKDQQEIDHLWNALGEDGDPKAQQCGWLKDKYGVSWQIIPERMGEMMKAGNQEQVSRMLNAMYQMKKMDLSTLEAAFNGT